MHLKYLFGVLFHEFHLHSSDTNGIHVKGNWGWRLCGSPWPSSSHRLGAPSGGLMSSPRKDWSELSGPLLLTLEKAMAPHSSTLAWKIPWTEEPGRLQSMGSLRVGHDWETSLSLFTSMHWRRKWQPTPVFLPGESQGWGSLVGCSLWSCTGLDMTEAT